MTTPTAGQDLKFVTAERVGMTQYVYLGYIRRLSNKTVTRNAVSFENPQSVNMFSLAEADRMCGGRLTPLEVVLVNPDRTYDPQSVLDFARNFNRQGCGWQIGRVLNGDKSVRMERMSLMN